MNSYNFKCSDCENEFTVDATLQEKEEGTSEKFTCPKCHSQNVKSEFSAINFIRNIFKSDGKASCCGSKNDSDDCC